MSRRSFYCKSPLLIILAKNSKFSFDLGKFKKNVKIKLTLTFSFLKYKGLKVVFGKKTIFKIVILDVATCRLYRKCL